MAGIAGKVEATPSTLETMKEQIREHPLLDGALCTGVAIAGGIACSGRLAEVWPSARALFEDLSAAKQPGAQSQLLDRSEMRIVGSRDVESSLACSHTEIDVRAEIIAPSGHSTLPPIGENLLFHQLRPAGMSHESIFHNIESVWANGRTDTVHAEIISPSGASGLPPLGSFSEVPQPLTRLTEASRKSLLKWWRASENSIEPSAHPIKISGADTQK